MFLVQVCNWDFIYGQLQYSTAKLEDNDQNSDDKYIKKTFEWKL